MINHRPYSTSSSAIDVAVSILTVLQIRPCNSLVQTSTMVMIGTTSSSTRPRRVSQFSCPVYSSASTSAATGPITIPRYSTLAQKTIDSRSALLNSSAYPNVHSATANIITKNGV